MRYPIRILGPLTMIGLIIVLLAQSNNTNANGGHSSPGQMPLGPIHSPIPGSSTIGLPAIQPHAISSSANTPSFTADEVKAYILTATVPKLIPIQGAHLTIEKVLFISSKEATQLMRGASPGVPDDALVCFVLVKGPFYVQVDYAPGTSANPAATAREIGEVFDAHTGNLLVWTVLG